LNIRITLLPGLLLLWYSVVGQDKNLQFYYAQAQAAYKAKAYPKFYEMIKEANTLHPYHQGILYQLGLAAALTGHKAEAFVNLKKAILIDTGFKLEGLTDFNSIKATPDFNALLDLQKEWSRPVIHSDTAMILKDRKLHTEGIAFDPANKNFYLGSIHLRKIVKTTLQGPVTDFCESGFDGMTSIFGIKIDDKNKVLWACSSPMPEMEHFDSTARSAVFKFDLTTGKLIEKIQRPHWENDGVFGDLVLSPQGEVFVSDGKNNMIFVVNEKTQQLEPFFTSLEFWNLQGLAFSETGKYLFAADYVKGLYRLDLKSKELISIPCPPDVSLKGIDGLNFYGNSLIAIQNGVSPLRVMRYFLNTDQSQITRFEVIDRKHPAFDEPTMGVIVGNDFYYIANSQWNGYDARHHIKAEDKLEDIVILKYKFR
jgi:hypothetical protein